MSTFEYDEDNEPLYDPQPAEEAESPEPEPQPDPTQAPSSDSSSSPQPISDDAPTVGRLPQPTGFPGHAHPAPNSSEAGPIDPEVPAEAGVVQEDLAAGTQASQGWLAPGEAPGTEATEDGPLSYAGNPQETPVAPGSSNRPGNAGSEHPPPSGGHE